MTELIVTLTDETRARLEALAGQMELSVTQCLDRAVAEFVDSWEDHLRTVAALAEDEARPILRAVNE